MEQKENNLRNILQKLEDMCKAVPEYTSEVILTGFSMSDNTLEIQFPKSEKLPILRLGQKVKITYSLE